jgi:hypothetical protein
MGKLQPALVSERQRTLLRRYADATPPPLREPFITTVMAHLSGPEVGDGALLAAIDHALGAARRAAPELNEVSDVQTNVCHS